MIVIKIIGVKADNRQGDDSDFSVFALESVNYINVRRPGKTSDLVPVYHTSDGSFMPLLTLRDISTALKAYGFSYYDRSTIINNARVTKVTPTEEGQMLKFVDDVEIIVAKKSRM
ncbi:LytTR family transcriptional regulator DNA-binding domain-containing protein [Paenibacillus sp. 598K]|uniref:LytTR family transcriptional regulator DNA-binding domain-containing protein n=1 Tax=Paenibacillus sp. 598K TaxID=1117987 RepID=UPI0016273C11|nr:LytTR family transcriptional regulator DNA-binding domain-containing protein [Paenibacillus sp. 598K]